VKRAGLRAALYSALAILYLAHNDPWLRDDARVVLGLPVGLAYHVAYALVAAGLMALLVRFAWPRDLASESEDPGAR
jgi:hypothetical protein